METSLHKSVVPGDAAKEENKGSESNGDKEVLGKEIVLQVGTGKIVKDDDGMKPASPDQKNFTSSKQLNERLESAKSEMGKVIEENQRLKMYLDQILKDYRTLQMQYQDHVIQQEAAKTCPNTAPTNRDQTEEPQLIALSLGRNSSGTMRQKIPTNDKLDEGNERLKLQMDCKYQVPKTLSPAKHCLNPSPENSLEEVKETMKNVRDCGEDEISLQNPGKRARVSVRVRCDTPTMNDGCQWRKYGQKIAKGIPCPRAYYRCTVGPSCPVRKQVQRYAKDMSILITTYEGKHNHPLSVSATALASATSAAAAMLFTGSSTSDLGPSSSSATTTTANLNGLNFYLSDNTRSKPLYLQNSSISSSPSYPTITLDLTTTPSSSLSSSSLSHLSRLGHFPLSNPTPNPNFNPLESSALPSNISWHNGILSYGHQPCNKSQSTNSRSFGENPNETLFQSCVEKNTVNPGQQNLAPDTIAAATKAITSDPRFQSALVAALSSIIGSGGDNNGNLENRKIAENSTENIKSSEPFPIISGFTATPYAQKCSPSSINKSSSSTSSQWGGFTFNSPLFSLSNSRSKSNSSGDHNRDHII